MVYKAIQDMFQLSFSFPLSIKGINQEPYPFHFKIQIEAKKLKLFKYIESIGRQHENIRLASDVELKNIIYNNVISKSEK